MQCNAMQCNGGTVIPVSTYVRESMSEYMCVPEYVHATASGSCHFMLMRVEWRSEGVRFDCMYV